MNTTANPVDQEFGIDQFAASATEDDQERLANIMAVIATETDPVKRAFAGIEEMVDLKAWRPAAVFFYRPILDRYLAGMMPLDEVEATGMLSDEIVDRKFGEPMSERDARHRKIVTDWIEVLGVCEADGRVSKAHSEHYRKVCQDYVDGATGPSGDLHDVLLGCVTSGGFAV